MADSTKRAPLDPILRKVLEAVPFQLTVDGGVEEARRRLRELPRPQFHDDLRVQDMTIDGPGGPIPVRVYWPDNEADIHPVTMYFHGGGFALGDLERQRDVRAASGRDRRDAHARLARILVGRQRHHD